MGTACAIQIYEKVQTATIRSKGGKVKQEKTCFLVSYNNECYVWLWGLKVFESEILW
jgi:hypothetical protein